MKMLRQMILVPRIMTVFQLTVILKLGNRLMGQMNLIMKMCTEQSRVVVFGNPKDTVVQTIVYNNNLPVPWYRLGCIFFIVY